MTTNEFFIYATMLVSVLFFGGAAILALSWGVRTGQFENFERSARGIFDPDEPIGQLTDSFPEDVSSEAHREPKTSTKLVPEIGSRNGHSPNIRGI